jgi:hypothetical protein
MRCGCYLQPLHDPPYTHRVFPVQTQGDSYGRFLRACQGDGLLTESGLPGWFEPLPQGVHVYRLLRREPR